MSKPTLGGVLFIYRGVDQDYHFRESITCLAEFCDEVSISIGGQDGTIDQCYKLIEELELFYPTKKFIITVITEDHWNSQQGREKLSYFSNIAIEKLSTDYVFYLQADEIVTEESYEEIRKAIETGEEAFLVSRVNFWFDPVHYLTVPHERQPVGTAIVRLGKKHCRCVDDAESLYAGEIHNWIDRITMLHMGFVRQKEKHMTKIRHIQGEIFQIEVDKRCDGMTEFKPEVFFSREDVTRYPHALPVVIREWVRERYPEL